MTIEQSVWSKTISARNARAVARALKAKGYYVTISDVRERSSIINLGRYLEPMDITAQHQVFRVIAAACGLQPGQD